MSKTKENGPSPFEARAKKLGHDINVIKRKGIQSTVIRVKTLKDLRDLMGPSNPGVRAGRREDYRELYLTREQGNMLRKIEAYVIADADLTAAEIRHIERRHFPIEVEAVSKETHTVAANTVWLIETSGMNKYFNFSVLTMEPGSQIEIKNTPLTLKCDSLIRQEPANGAASTSVGYDIGILGVTQDRLVRLTLPSRTFSSVLDGEPHPTSALIASFTAAQLPLSAKGDISVLAEKVSWLIVDRAVQGGLGAAYALDLDITDSTKINVRSITLPGVNGDPGTDGPPGEQGQCKNSGAECGTPATNGISGGPGGNGSRGTNALPGLDSLPAEIEIGELNGNLVVFSQGGNGSRGGSGGNGGKGGNGGHGGNAKYCCALGCAGAVGGDAGRGGDGNDGGTGGNGGNAQPVHITVNPAQKNQVQGYSLPSLVGFGGLPGAEGAPGMPGVAGLPDGYGAPKGSPGNTNSPGKPGNLGGHGEHPGLAGPVYINK